ncbi:TolC family protein [Anaerotignum faecicola]
MKFYPYKKACALLVTGALTTGAAVPALAAEAKTEAPQNAEESKTKAMTLKEIQELVVKNNRLKTTLTLNQEKVIAGLSAIDDGLKDLKDSQDKAAHARRDASDAASKGQAAINGTLSLPGAATGTNKLWGTITSGLLSGAVKTASGMETLVDNVADRQRDTLEDQQTELKNTKMDLNKTKEDWENESLAVTQLLVTKTVQVEKGVSLLTQKQSLLERVCRIEEKKQELGFSTGTDLSEKKLAVSEGAKELQSAKDGLTLLKRQLNDLMGREIDEELIITPPELTRTIETAPAYSEELLKTATDKNYKLKTLRRDKQQAEVDSKKNDRYDGQLKASRVDMQLADVSTEEEKVNIANDLKKKLDAINTAAAEYQNKKDANSKAKIEWEQQQKSAKLGLVSAVELQALELQYEQTEMELSVAAYAYDLAWEEYTMLMNGTTLDIYDVYKSKLS